MRLLWVKLLWSIASTNLDYYNGQATRQGENWHLRRGEKNSSKCQTGNVDTVTLVKREGQRTLTVTFQKVTQFMELLTVCTKTICDNDTHAQTQTWLMSHYWFLKLCLIFTLKERPWTHGEISLLAFLPRVRGEDWHHTRTCTVNINLDPQLA